MLSKLLKIDHLIMVTVFALLFPILSSAANFTDNHNDNVITGWAINGSRPWSETNGQLYPGNNNGNAGFILNNATPSTDGALEVVMTADQWNGIKGGVVFRWTSASSYYYVAVNPGNQYSNYIAFCRNSLDAATGTKVAQNFAMNSTFTLKIEMNRNTFKFYIDGVLRGQITDTVNTSGKIGYAYSTDWNSYTSYDNITWTESVVNYSLSTSVQGQGTITPANGSYVADTTTSITATPVTGWHFDHWSGDITGTTNPIPVTFNANKTITATFVQDTIRYTLATTVAGQGSVSPASGNYIQGTIVSLTATPVTGWHFDHWSGDITGTTNPIPVTFNANKTITATFVQDTIRYTLATTVAGQGSVSPASGTYIQGTIVSLTATPVTGWHFDHWSGDITGTTNPVPVTFNANKTITANFVQDTIRYTLATTVAGQGSVSPASGTYIQGTIVSLTATPVTGWHFDHWSGDITGTTNPVPVTFNANKNITANFAEDAGVPNSQKVSISARLLGSDGTPVGNDLAVMKDVIVKLYDDRTGGELKYTENFFSVNNRAAVIDRGYFTVRLGSGTTNDNLGQVISANNNLWIEISVDGTTFSQRIPLTAAPYVVNSTSSVVP